MIKAIFYLGVFGALIWMVHGMTSGKRATVSATAFEPVSTSTPAPVPSPPSAPLAPYNPNSALREQQQKDQRAIGEYILRGR